jgi:hypothetical protein
MPRPDRTFRRRTVLRTAATSGLAVAGLTASAGAAAATEADCRVCWADVKPDSCPNAINPDQNGVVSVAAGWPHYEPGTVELVPVSEACAEDVGYEPAFDRCQDYQNQQYASDCTTLEALAACASDDRAATPVRSTTEDIDDDGDPDSVFKFETADLELQPDDAYLLLVGESTDGGRVYGIDSVRVVDRGQGNGNGGQNGNANGAQHGR